MKTLFFNGNIISKGKVFPGMVLLKDGVIENILPSPFALPQADKMVDLQGSYLAPGFIDTHIHGFGGFGTDNKNPDDLLKMSKLLMATGVIAFCPTIYPSKTEDMVETLTKLSTVVGKEEGAKIIGFHLEGPFISPEKPGVMKPEDIQPVTVEAMQKIYDAANGKIASMTVAPELKNIEFLVDFAKEHNFILQAGHTNATYEEMENGVMLGINHSTHLFNAMRGFSHRDPGVVGAILTDDNISTEVIADGHHISPVVINMILKLKSPSKIVLVTDSLNPTGKKEGKANGEDVYLDNGVFKRKEDNVIAGSALTMLKAMKNLVRWGYPLGNASLAVSDNPAALFKLDIGSIEKGKKAAFVILDKDLKLKCSVFS